MIYPSLAIAFLVCGLGVPAVAAGASTPSAGHSVWEGVRDLLQEHGIERVASLGFGLDRLERYDFEHAVFLYRSQSDALDSHLVIVPNRSYEVINHDYLRARGVLQSLENAARCEPSPFTGLAAELGVQGLVVGRIYPDLACRIWVYHLEPWYLVATEWLTFDGNTKSLSQVGREPTEERIRELAYYVGRCIREEKWGCAEVYLRELGDPASGTRWRSQIALWRREIALRRQLDDLVADGLRDAREATEAETTVELWRSAFRDCHRAHKWECMEEAVRRLRGFMREDSLQQWLNLTDMGRLDEQMERLSPRFPWPWAPPVDLAIQSVVEALDCDTTQDWCKDMMVKGVGSFLAEQQLNGIRRHVQKGRWDLAIHDLRWLIEDVRPAGALVAVKLDSLDRLIRSAAGGTDQPRQPSATKRRITEKIEEIIVQLAFVRIAVPRRLTVEPKFAEERRPPLTMDSERRGSTIELEQLALPPQRARRPRGRDLGVVDAQAEATRQLTDGCYTLAKQKDPDLEGSIAVSFTIGTDGSVSDVFIAYSTVRNRDVEGCVMAVVESWKFDAAPTSDVVEFVFTFQSR